MLHADRPLEFWTSRCPIDATRLVACQPRKVRHGISRRIRAQHPTRMRVCIRKSSYSMPQLINQAINQQETKQTTAGMPQQERTSSSPCISGIKHDFQWIGSARLPSAWTWTSHCPIDAMRRLASQPRSVRYGIPRRMRAQHQTTMTVHVRKLNRGMKQSTINKASKNNKSW